MDINNLTKRAQELWNGWELRSLILMSLFLQILLILIGNRRKYTSGIVLGMFVWTAYLSADGVAIFALGLASRNQGSARSETNGTNPNPSLIPAFWAPILLVHLGGPDTITAYALEDNELWLRHLLQLGTQAVWAAYALFKSWGKDPLIIIAIPVFVAGIVKYGERILVLWLASSKKFRNTQSDKVDAFQRKYVKQFQSHDFIDMSIDELRRRLGFDNIIPEALYLHEAYLLFQMLKILFADLALSHSIHMASYHILKDKMASDHTLKKKGAIEAFKVIEVEMGFMYDALFTKMTRVCSWRTILRFVSFSCSTSALILFALMVGSKPGYPRTEVIISYILLGGGVVLEIYSAIMLLLSDWAMLRLSFSKKGWVNSICLAIRSDNDKKWERYMAQHDLADAKITEDEGLCVTIINFLKKTLLCSPTAKDCSKNLVGKGNIQRWEIIIGELKKLILEYLLDKRSRYSHEMPQPDPGMNDLKEILAERGDQVLKSEGCFAKFGWTLDDFDFHATLLLWHIATDICYYDDVRRTAGDARNFDLSNCKMSRSLSNYMLYLLSECPTMLPTGIGGIRYKQTGIQVNEFSWCWRTIPAPENTKWESDGFSNQIRIKGSNVSVLNDACKLAKELQSLEGENAWSKERKWKMISKMWVEMLTYAATNCAWREHGQALTRGGELLTRVSLLMVHLGLSEQCVTSDQKEKANSSGV